MFYLKSSQPFAEWEEFLQQDWLETTRNSALIVYNSQDKRQPFYIFTTDGAIAQFALEEFKAYAISHAEAWNATEARTLKDGYIGNERLLE